jgi:transcriptional regulator GlxA family with amidase domain
MNDDLSAAPCIAFVAYPGAGLLDIAGAQSVFWAAARAMESRGKKGYRCVILSVEGGLVTTAEGLTVDTLPIPSSRSSSIGINTTAQTFDTLIVAGSPDITQTLTDNPRLIDWIAEQAPAVRRVASICSGTFLLAAAGLLDGKCATTHWSLCAALEAGFPRIQVDRDAMFIQQGSLWTCGGTTSGIDLALALVEADCGREVAMQVGRELLVFIKRPGGQPQLSELLVAQSSGGERFDELHLWLVSNMGRNDLSVSLLAQQMHMSTRNFSRLYKRSTGRTPAKTIELFRVGSARRMLQDSDRNIDQVACACGFGDEERMRVTFHRHLGLSPRDYRARYLATTD